MGDLNGSPIQKGDLKFSVTASKCMCVPFCVCVCLFVCVCVGVCGSKYMKYIWMCRLKCILKRKKNLLCVCFFKNLIRFSLCISLSCCFQVNHRLQLHFSIRLTSHLLAANKSYVPLIFDLRYSSLCFLQFWFFFSQTVSISNTVSPFLCPFTTPSNSIFLLFFFHAPLSCCLCVISLPLHHLRLSHGPAFQWVLQRAVKTPSVVHAAPACPASTGTPRRRSPRYFSESPTGARATLCPPLVCGWVPA